MINITKRKIKTTCVFCGCLCDDILVSVTDNHITKIENACILGEEKIFSAIKNKRNQFFQIKEGDKKKNCSFNTALDRAADLLVNSEKPLLYGWSNTTCEAQKIGLKLAEILGGVWDNTTSTCHGPSAIAISERGISSATLGEIKNRADTIIYWGCNPVESHPRHLHRYTYFAKGRFRNREDRKMIVVDVRKTPTAKLSDLFIQIKPGCDYELLTALHITVKTGEKPEVTNIVSSINEFDEFVNFLNNTEFGVIFFGLGLTMSGYGSINVEALLSLIRELNNLSKWVTMPMRGHFNVTGANTVASYLTGFPFGIDFSDNKPYYNPGETTALDIIENNDCDLLMSVASDPIGMFPANISSKCLDLKIIALDPFPTITTEVADILFPVSISGIETGGTAYRMDGVPLPLKKIIDNSLNLPSDKEVLEQLLDKVKELIRR
ncbi:MAG: formylmethanofuran dehydrogenase subunit B [Candidatus Odinarchaeia archaeon]